MTPEQRFLFDVDGMIVVPDALTPEQCVEVNSVMDARSAQGLEAGGSTNRVEQQLLPAEGEPFPSASSARDNPLHFAPVFRALLDNPRITPILEEIIGSGGLASSGYHHDQAEAETLPTFRIDHINLNHIVANTGGRLHNSGDGSSHAGGAQFFHQQDGFIHSGLLVVAYEFVDTTVNCGGFGCIPGTHKARSALPDQWQDLSASAGPPNLRRVPAAAGSAIIFSECLTHVTLPWTALTPRRVGFYKYSPHGVAYSGNYLNAPEFEQYPDMTARMLALLEPPNARYPGRPRDYEYIPAALSSHHLPSSIYHLCDYYVHSLTQIFRQSALNLLFEYGCTMTL